MALFAANHLVLSWLRQAWIKGSYFEMVLRLFDVRNGLFAGSGWWRKRMQIEAGARRIAANIAKLPELLQSGRRSPQDQRSEEGANND
jgi:hypothetical protein